LALFSVSRKSRIFGQFAVHPETLFSSPPVHC